jgi:carbamoyltransferase
MSSNIVWGVSALSHDASLCVIEDRGSSLLYASHAERYSRVKNDGKLHQLQVNEAISLYGQPRRIYWFEDPLLKRLRFLTSGNYTEAFSLDNSPRKMMNKLGIRAPILYSKHHRSHASATFYTRPCHWDGPADVLVADAIGEYDTLTTWTGDQQKLVMVDKPMRYPKSLGLFYTAVTLHVGLKPNEEEYILMGMAAYGKANEALVLEFTRMIKMGVNFHRGLGPAGVFPEFLTILSHEDLAATAQTVIEHWMIEQAAALRHRTGSKFLCLSGGVALNCVANTKVAKQSGYEDVWIMPNPGDAGSSLGAVTSWTKRCVDFDSTFLGTDIPRKVTDQLIVNHLAQHRIAGLARGRAEWGPRALGNRSLLADPRKIEYKDLVNTVKRRQKFRPFAPMVLCEYASQYFELPQNVSNMQYMQYAIRCKTPDKIPAVVHEDGTSRVQIIGPTHAMRKLLEHWFYKTGCPVLLNTSLNVKGEPLVNNREDANAFERKNKIKVFT